MATLLNRLFDSVGDGSGTTEMATTADAYFVTPAATQQFCLHRMNLYIEDNGKFRGDRYGATGALSNGIVVTLEDASGVIHTFTPQAVKVIGHWALVAGVDMILTDFTTGNDIVLVRWTFHKGHGNRIIVDGDSGEFLKFNVQDDMSDLVSHMAQVQGVIE